MLFRWFVRPIDVNHLPNGLQENDIVTVLYAVNDEWWYGELGQRRGQFPAAFVETI